MASGELSVLSRHLRGLALLQDGAGLTDRQLLECFLAHREEAAFQALVGRHGPVVLGVCQRVLHNAHDAEDAFQATFMVFIRKAAFIRKREVVSHWLYKVAIRTARKMKAMIAKRRNQEKKAAANQATSPSKEDSWQEWEPILDEEMERLPEKYQLPIVLCDLEGKTQKEAAKQVGCPLGIFSARLTRGRQMLAKRLARRGVTLTAGSLAALLPQHATCAAPLPLVVSTVKAAMLFGFGRVASSAISTTAVALADGVLKAMLVSKLKVAGALVLAMGIVSAGAGISLVAEQPGREAVRSDEPKEQHPRRLAPKPKKTPNVQADTTWPKEHPHPVTINGTTRDEKGNPIKGATVYLVSTGKNSLVATTISDQRGNYVFKDVPMPIIQGNKTVIPAGTYEVYGKAKGFGFAWQGSRWFFPKARPENYRAMGEDYHFFLDEPMAANLVFGSEAKLKGKVVDETGKPVRDAKILLESADHLDTTGREPDISDRIFNSLYFGHGLTNSAKTNDKGYFEISGLPKEVAFWMYVRHSDYARIRLYAATTDKPIKERVYVPWPGGKEERIPVATGELALTLTATRIIDVQVLYADTGKAAPRTSVYAESIGRQGQSQVDSSNGTTDASGKVRLRLPPGDYKVTIYPPRDIGYVQTELNNLVVAKEPREQKFQAKVNPGCILILEAIDADTGKGIADVDFGYKADDELGWSQVKGSMAGYNPVTDATGKLRVVVYPGKRRYRAGFTTLPKDYQYDHTPSELLELAPGKTVTCQFKFQKK